MKSCVRDKGGQQPTWHWDILQDGIPNLSINPLFFWDKGFSFPDIRNHYTAVGERMSFNFREKAAKRLSRQGKNHRSICLQITGFFWSSLLWQLADDSPQLEFYSFRNPVLFPQISSKKEYNLTLVLYLPFNTITYWFHSIRKFYQLSYWVFGSKGN